MKSKVYLQRVKTWNKSHCSRGRELSTQEDLAEGWQLQGKTPKSAPASVKTALNTSISCAHRHTLASRTACYKKEQSQLVSTKTSGSVRDREREAQPALVCISQHPPTRCKLFLRKERFRALEKESNGRLWRLWYLGRGPGDRQPPPRKAQSAD